MQCLHCVTSEVNWKLQDATFFSVRIGVLPRSPFGEHVNVENREFLRLMALSGWNQAKAARKLGVTPASVSRYIADLARPSRPVLQRFADILGEQVELPGESLVPLEMRDANRKLEEWEGRLVRAVRDFEPDRRQSVAEAILHLIEAMRPKAKSCGDRGPSVQPSGISYDLISAEEVVGIVLEDKLAEMRGGHPKPTSERLHELVVERQRAAFDQRTGDRPSGRHGGKEGS